MNEVLQTITSLIALGFGALLGFGCIAIGEDLARAGHERPGLIRRFTYILACLFVALGIIFVTAMATQTVFD